VRSSLLGEVALLADAVGLAKPGEELGVKLAGRVDGEGMDMIAWRERFDFREARVAEAAGEDDVPDEAFAA